MYLLLNKTSNIIKKYWRVFDHTASLDFIKKILSEKNLNRPYYKPLTLIRKLSETAYDGQEFLIFIKKRLMPYTPLR
jgi:hypothetical protein